MYDRVLVSRSEVTLIALTGLAVGMLVIYGLLEGIRAKILVRISLQFDELVSSKLFNMIFETQILKPRLSGTQVFRDVDNIRDFVGGAAIISLCDAPWVPIFIGACFILHPILGFVALTGAILVFVLAAINEWITRRPLSEANTNAIYASSYAMGSLRNAEIIKALGMFSGVRKGWLGNRDNMLKHQSVASDRAGGIVAASRFIRMSLQVVMLATGGYLAIQDLITPGTMIAASIIMGRALAPVELAVSQWRNLVLARDSYNRIKRLIEQYPEEPERLDLPAPQGLVELQGVFIRPPESETIVVSNLSMIFEPGTVTGIVGPSGSGKSTLARAMVGVWPLLRGNVRYDGASLTNWSSDRLGPFIGYMPQDVELFDGSVATNIARFQEADANAIVSAAKKAGVHDLILKLPDGYNTNIGANGQALSGGQRQRLALARAIYKNPKVIVLDEPNSNLDADGEKALTEAINSLKNDGSTVIVISHRPSLLANTDKIAVLNLGNLVKFGGRDEVLRELSGGRV
tara:strand:+ start:4353 stop:5906 length:1554 start_codon:yes stop_codon:yes gene_type:complete